METAKILYKEAEKMGLHPVWLTNYGLFSIKVNGKLFYIFYSKCILNNSIGSYLAKNKHATRVILGLNNFLNIPFALPENKEEVKKFLKEHGTLVAKPTLGANSRGLRVINSLKDIKGINLLDYIFEKFIEGKEIRYLVLNNEVLSVHEKSFEGPITNPSAIKRISYPKEAWESEMTQTALSVAATLYLKFAAIDFLIDENGKAYILEVNSAPGLRFFQHPSSGPSLDIAKIFLEETIKAALNLPQANPNLTNGITK